VEPKIGDFVRFRGEDRKILCFSEDHGTQLDNYQWICMSEFERGGDGVWIRIGSESPCPFRAGETNADWAGTTEDMYDFHRFPADKRAACNPAIRTYSSTQPDDAFRQPYMTLRTRTQIEANGFGHMYRFCPDCSKES
jgi:hypothetical protein